MPHKQHLHTTHNIGESSWKKSLDRLVQPGALGDCSTCASLLRCCANDKALSDGKRVHNHIIHRRLEPNLFLANLLLHMYGNCGALQDAHTVFGSMHRWDMYSWNFMIKAYIKHGQSKDALQLFEHMQLQGVIPNKFIYVSIFSVFANKTTLAESKEMHARIVDTGFESDMIVITALVNMYSKCGKLRDARQMFDKMLERDAVSWNAVVSGYAQHGLRKDAVQLFSQMRCEGLDPNRATIVSIISICDNRAALDEGKWMHSQIEGTGFESDVVVGNALVTMYGKCGSLEDAERVFEKMPQRDKTTFLNILAACASQASLAKGKRVHDYILDSGLEPEVVIGNALISMYGKCGSLGEARKMFDKMVVQDLISWNAMIAVYAQNGEGKAALQLFKEMQQRGTMPNKVTYVSTVDACASQEAQTEGKWLHASITGSDFELDVVLGTALVHMYGKCNNMEDARIVFDKIPEHDVASWNAMITVYAHHGESKDAFLLFEQMQQESVMPDKITFVSVLSACTTKAVLLQGKCLHACIVCSGFASDIVVGNAVINMYGKSGGLEDALRLLETMPKLDNVSFINFFSACATEAALDEGRRIHARIMGSQFEADVVVGNALINMYGKCGNMDTARCFFNNMPERNVVSWNAMIAIYAQSGHDKIALELFSEMGPDSVVPNDITFVCVLSAFSHTGLVDEGWLYFLSMIQDYGIAPTADHYNIMIDLLGRAGRLDEAEDLISRMPFKPSVITWTTLLGACRSQADVERGERAAERVFTLNPEKSSAYVTLSNLYTASGRGDDAAVVMDMLRDKGLKKQQRGCSSVEISSSPYGFPNHNQSCLQIYASCRD